MMVMTTAIYIMVAVMFYLMLSATAEADPKP
jgi:hypothetical protein